MGRIEGSPEGILSTQMLENRLPPELLKETLEQHKLPDIVIEHLRKSAEYARSFSYSPYSKFRVGAALLTKDGDVT